MKFKSFDKVNVAVEYEVVVFNADDPIDDFVIDYLGDHKNLSKKVQYADAKVRYVSVNSATHRLSVTLEV